MESHYTMKITLRATPSGANSCTQSRSKLSWSGRKGGYQSTCDVRATIGMVVDVLQQPLG
jgi:hypothetical protein